MPLVKRRKKRRGMVEVAMPVKRTAGTAGGTSAPVPRIREE